MAKNKKSQLDKFSSKERALYGEKILREEHDDMVAARMMSEFYGEDVLDATDLNEAFLMFNKKNKKKNNAAKNKSRSKRRRKRR